MESEPKVLTRGSGLVNIAQLLDFLLHFIFYAYRWLLDTDLQIIVTVGAITVTLFALISSIQELQCIKVLDDLIH